MTTKASNKRPPYDNRNLDSMGKYQGVGISSSVGLKKGSYTDYPMATAKEVKKSKPPRKMN